MTTEWPLQAKLLLASEGAIERILFWMAVLFVTLFHFFVEMNWGHVMGLRTGTTIYVPRYEVQLVMRQPG